MRNQGRRLQHKGTILAGLLGVVALAASASGQASSLTGNSIPTAQIPENSQQVRPVAVLLELFTSEGCSSCPPADALLRALAGRQMPSGQLLIGLSEHVTYWNNLGWTDPYSNELYTARQTSYSEKFNLGSVYTPQLIINGSEQIVGSDRRGLARALAAEQQHQKSQQTQLSIGTVRRTHDGIAITYTLSSLPSRSHAQLFAAVADDLDRSSVLRGENEGRTLNHSAVVRSLVEIGPALEGAGQQITLHLPAAHAASDTRQHVVLFAQEANFGSVLGVTEQALALP